MFVVFSVNQGFFLCQCFLNWRFFALVFFCVGISVDDGFHGKCLLSKCFFVLVFFLRCCFPALVFSVVVFFHGAVFVVGVFVC